MKSTRILFRLMIISSLIVCCALPALTAPPQRNVYVGIFLADVSGFSLTEGRFHADLYVWCKWLGGDKTEIPKLHFPNGEISEQKLERREQEGNWHSVRWHVRGVFRGAFPLHDFPFDHQKLRIRVELEPGFGRLVPDLAGSGMVRNFSISGWQYSPYFRAETSLRTYHSDFGSISHEGENLQRQSLAFVLDLTRPIVNYLIKFALPLMIVIGVSLVSFFTRRNIEAILGVGITALLTAVALHFSLGESLPNVPYMVSADKLFILSYGHL